MMTELLKIKYQTLNIFLSALQIFDVWDKQTDTKSYTRIVQMVIWTFFQLTFMVFFAESSFNILLSRL